MHACPVLNDCSLPDAVSITFDAIGVDHVDVLLLGQIHNPETAVTGGVSQEVVTVDAGSQYRPPGHELIGPAIRHPLQIAEPLKVTLGLILGAGPTVLWVYSFPIIIPLIIVAGEWLWARLQPMTKPIKRTIRRFYEAIVELNNRL